MFFRFILSLVFVSVLLVSCGFPTPDKFNDLSVYSQGDYSLNLAKFKLDDITEAIKYNDISMGQNRIFTHTEPKPGGSTASIDHRINVPLVTHKIDLSSPAYGFLEETLEAGSYPTSIDELQLKEGILKIRIKADIKSRAELIISSQNIKTQEGKVLEKQIIIMPYNSNTFQDFNIPLDGYTIQPDITGGSPERNITFSFKGFIDVKNMDLVENMSIDQIISFESLVPNLVKGKFGSIILPKGRIDANFSNLTGGEAPLTIKDKGKKVLYMDIINPYGVTIRVNFLKIEVITASGEVRDLILKTADNVENIVGGYGFRNNKFYMAPSELDYSGKPVPNRQTLIFSEKSSNIQEVLKGNINRITIEVNVLFNPTKDIGPSILLEDQYIDYTEPFSIGIKLQFPVEIKTKF